jgi:hypothetical protein
VLPQLILCMPVCYAQLATQLTTYLFRISLVENVVKGATSWAVPKTDLRRATEPRSGTV